MDPLTHSLVGAALVKALPMPEAGRRGLFFAMFMSAAPDLDVLPAFIAKLPGNLIPGEILFDPYWMRLHRGLTHSLFFALVFGVLAGRVFGRSWKWAGFAVLALLSHVLLDLLNAGVALWEPFSDAWASLGDLPVVDPFVLPPLLCCFFACVSPSEAWRRKGRGIARWCLLFIAARCAAGMA